MQGVTLDRIANATQLAKKYQKRVAMVAVEHETPHTQKKLKHDAMEDVKDV